MAGATFTRDDIFSLNGTFSDLGASSGCKVQTTTIYNIIMPASMKPGMNPPMNS